MSSVHSARIQADRGLAGLMAATGIRFLAFEPTPASMRFPGGSARVVAGAGNILFEAKASMSNYSLDIRRRLVAVVDTGDV